MNQLPKSLAQEAMFKSKLLSKGLRSLLIDLVQKLRKQSKLKRLRSLKIDMVDAIISDRTISFSFQSLTICTSR